MIEEASAENIAALGIDEAEFEGEDTANATMDEDNLSYMESPDPEDGIAALRSARGSSGENTTPGIIDEFLPRRQVEDEDEDPVGESNA